MLDGRDLTICLSGNRSARAADWRGNFLTLLARPIIWALGGMLFLYVGGEMGIGAWLFLYLRSAAGLGATIASSGVSFYWLGLIAGRITGGRLAHRIAVREFTISPRYSQPLRWSA